MRTESPATRTRVALLGVLTVASAAPMTTVAATPSVAERAAPDGWGSADTESPRGIFT